MTPIRGRLGWPAVHPACMAENANDPDHELVRRAQKGDTQAFDELVIKYSRKLYGLVYNMKIGRASCRERV